MCGVVWDAGHDILNQQFREEMCSNIFIGVMFDSSMCPRDSFSGFSNCYTYLLSSPLGYRGSGHKMFELLKMWQEHQGSVLDNSCFGLSYTDVSVQVWDDSSTQRREFRI